MPDGKQECQRRGGALVGLEGQGATVRGCAVNGCRAPTVPKNIPGFGPGPLSMAPQIVVDIIDSFGMYRTECPHSTTTFEYRNVELPGVSFRIDDRYPCVVWQGAGIFVKSGMMQKQEY